MNPLQEAREYADRVSMKPMRNNIYAPRKWHTRKTTRNWELALLWITIISLVVGGVPHV